MKEFLISQARRRVYRLIPTDNVWPPVQAVDFEPDSCYVRLWLNEMYLAHSRILYKTRSPLVHAICGLNHEDFRFVVGPSQRGDLPAGFERLLNLNYSLLGPVPYRGGDLELLITLSAIELNDYGDHLLKVLGTLSELICSSEIKATLPLVGIFKSGVEGLFGMDRLKMHLGVHDTLTPTVDSPHRLLPGYRVVIDCTDNEVDPGMLWVRDGRLCKGANIQSASPFESADYLLFSIESINRRGDDLPSVREAWNATIERALHGSDDEVDLAFSSFKMLVLMSPDLVWKDQQLRIETLNDRISVVRTQMGRRGFMSFDTSLAGALKQEQLAAHSTPQKMDLSREQLINLDWR